MPVAKLKDAIKISTQQNSQVFSVAVKTDDPNLSAATANIIARVFRQQIKKIMSVNNVTIVSRATPSFSLILGNEFLFSSIAGKPCYVKYLVVIVFYT